jgi:hypothetical protein
VRNDRVSGLENLILRPLSSEIKYSRPDTSLELRIGAFRM